MIYGGLGAVNKPLPIIFHSSMSILAHYCVIIHWAGQRFWCFEGCAASLMGEIHSELQGSSWEVALNWPLQMIAEIN